MKYGLVITICAVTIAVFFFTGIAITQDEGQDEEKPSPLQIAQRIRRSIEDLEDRITDLEGRVTDIEEAILAVEDEGANQESEDEK